MARNSIIKHKKESSRPLAKFSIDCAAVIEDNILDIKNLENFIHNNIKVNGIRKNFENRLQVYAENNKLIVSGEQLFPKRYLKYLTKKYLAKQSIRDFLRVIATNQGYKLSYFKISSFD